MAPPPPSDRLPDCERVRVPEQTAGACPAEAAIVVEQLGIEFRQYPRPIDRLWELFDGRPRHTSTWALREISFTVTRGEVVGVIGRNGAGKSTLLRLIAGTLSPSTGSIEVHGRLTSILELGAGFSGDYTGRDNARFSGLMMGMTPEEIERRLPWIIDFSELEAVIDHPFRTYSTGMQARLMFSTAVCIDPDVLLIDEVLAVGDVRFQHKCFQKISAFKQAGHTILLVSHDLNTVTSICDRAIFIDGGRIIEAGSPQHVTRVYYRTLFSQPAAPDPETAGEAPTASATPVSPAAATPCDGAPPTPPGSPAGHRLEPAREEGPAPSPPVAPVSSQSLPTVAVSPAAAPAARVGTPTSAITAGPVVHSPAEVETGPRPMRMGNGKARILDFGILDAAGRRTTVLSVGERFTFFLHAVFTTDVAGALAGFLVRNLRGIDVFGITTRTQGFPSRPWRRGETLTAVMRGTMWLANHPYFLTVSVADPHAEENVQYDMNYDALTFEVQRKEGIFTTSVVDLDATMAFVEPGEVGIGPDRRPPTEAATIDGDRHRIILADHAGSG